MVTFELKTFKLVNQKIYIDMNKIKFVSEIG